MKVYAGNRSGGGGRGTATTTTARRGGVRGFIQRTGARIRGLFGG